MNERELDKKFDETFKEMKNRYKTMTLNDILTIGMFCNIFKELNNKNKEA